MNRSTETLIADPGLRFLTGEGEMRKRIRELDWSGTELGDPACWPGSLKTAVSIMLDCAGPAYIAWGPNFIQLYNDAYIPILGELKHPAALGLSTIETWQEIWGEIVHPLFHRVAASGEAISMEHKLMPMLRNGYLEECYFSFTYSPLTDEAGNVTGVFVIPRETTHEFVSNRRANALRMLMQNLSDAQDMRGIRAAFEKTVSEYPQDLPFGLWYERRQDRTGLDLVAAAGIQRGSALSPEFLDPEHDSFYAGLENAGSPEIADRSFDDKLLHWSHPQHHGVNPQALFIKPLRYSNLQRPDGYVVVAVNPMRPNDEAEKEFLHAIRSRLESAVRRMNKNELERHDRLHEFQTVMAALPCLVWMSDTSKACIFVNRTWLEFRGRSLEQEIGDGWIEGVHPDDRDELDRSQRAFDERTTYTLEYRLMHADGDYRWMLDEGTPRYGINGEFLGYIGTCIDITERKKAEHEVLSSQIELRNLYERLKTVREEERYALAREVHDQLGQILSAAKIDVKLLEDDFRLAQGNLSRGDILTELRSACDTIEKAIQVVRRLATELRPPELESQGLRSAIEWHTRDFERRTKISCSVELPADMHELNDTVATALFRIFQEAMTNVLRHAKATHIWVTVECRAGEVRLRVLDNGVGIMPERANSSRSIGLKGMRERAAIAGGRVVVGTLGRSGTLVAATVPLTNDASLFQQEIDSDPYTGENA